MGWMKGIEPSTPGITIQCSNQLSYTHHKPVQPLLFGKIANNCPRNHQGGARGVLGGALQQREGEDLRWNVGEQAATVATCPPHAPTLGGRRRSPGQSAPPASPSRLSASAPSVSPTARSPPSFPAARPPPCEP